VGSRKLTNVDPPAWRVRVGDYRIVYEIDDEQIVVVVVNVAPRSEVYR
jgi:mRNA interferase RelE/StbE